MRFVLFFFITVTSISCDNTSNIQTLSSPSRNIKIRLDINHNRSQPTKYECLVLSIFNRNSEILTIEQTGASNYSKWAAAWHPKNDTFILYSQDIGSLAWRFDLKNIVEPIKVDSSLERLGKEAFNKKYSSN